MQRQASPAHMAKHQDMTREENAAPVSLAELQPHNRMLPRHWYRVEIKAARTQRHEYNAGQSHSTHPAVAAAPSKTGRTTCAKPHSPPTHARSVCAQKPPTHQNHPKPTKPSLPAPQPTLPKQASRTTTTTSSRLLACLSNAHRQPAAHKQIFFFPRDPSPRPKSGLLTPHHTMT
jgi:hypothetical protein